MDKVREKEFAETMTFYLHGTRGLPIGLIQVLIGEPPDIEKLKTLFDIALVLTDTLTLKALEAWLNAKFKAFDNERPADLFKKGEAWRVLEQAKIFARMENL